MPQGNRIVRAAGLATFAVAVAAPWALPALQGSAPAAATPPAQLRAAEVRSQRLLLDGPRRQRLTVTAPAGGARRVRVVLVGGGARRPIASWEVGPLAPGASRTLSWDGRTATGRRVPDGRFRFLAAVDDGPVAPAGAPFDAVRAFFPVRGPHTFGDGLGAGRGHQGQDVVAPCGTPVVAARAGVAREVGYDGVRGNHVVLDTAGGASAAYLHLQELPALAVGDRVVTGEALGLVGTTGHSTGCHLHFELWRAPGYWEGEPVDPAPLLRRWDAQTGAGRVQARS
ncbi:M23 family metallopeptidase [Conexibacter sp. SYSU D00693]|uniref:M23 family metallopeptidase n=1 Tax=Conexibacter sp. SYSU D00693 TaxID=2812560 RepID=UPI00196A28C8|nr:M23 family metallopeptidase [Conexibacter sp. SYSU D00693]